MNKNDHINKFNTRHGTKLGENFILGRDGNTLLLECFSYGTKIILREDQVFEWFDILEEAREIMEMKDDGGAE